MKSIMYKLFGIPHKMEDLVNLLGQNEILKISLRLKKNEIFRAEFSVIQLIAYFDIKLVDKNVCYSEICGACNDAGPEERKRNSIDNTNRKLKDIITRINNLGFEVQQNNRRF